MYTDPEHGANDSQSMFQRIINWLNPNKAVWYEKDEWYCVNSNEKAYKIGEKHDCPSWDIEFWYLDKYKNKDTCEERWVKSSKRMNDKTTFEEPDKVTGNDYIFFDEEMIYNGDKYE